ncbi:BglG family transcription antiterminator [Caproiciproducens faecalis]|uniref:Transcription antiterminator n=1 Tax=Caproiciproducens faecalis TaxID=2820301 RepID=A0ABS7DMP3_9FIRM|nr:BglG family transcription antiterminator [Caproiciproducens faecalis]MBW7572384.1 transcription antiterminator [Caproiciproducens faecalis]
MLTKIQIKLIQHLSETQTPLTAEDIAKLIDISSRTAKRYVEIINDEIKEYGLEIVSKRGVGYELKGDLRTVKKLLSGESYDDSAERVRSTLLTIIQSQPITIEALSGRVHLSPSTVNKMTPSVKDYLHKYGLELSSKPYYGLFIDGEEINIRTLLTDIGFNIEQGSFQVNLPNLSEKEYKQIDSAVLENLKRIQVVAADRDIQNLSMRIAVSFSRARQNCCLTHLSLPKNVRKYHLQVIHQIMDPLAKSFDIVLNDKEFQYIAALSGPVIQSFEADKVNVEDHIHTFVKDRIKEISLISGSEYSADEKVIESLSVHIKILLERMENQISVKNPLLSQIKKKYPIEMNYAIFLAQKIEKEYGVTIGEDELGYLAMHFGAFHERMNSRKKAAILCSYGIGTSQLITERISREIPELEIAGVYPIHYLESALAHDPDIVISTVDIDNYHSSIPLVVIEDFLGSDCIVRIKDALHHRGKEKPSLVSMFRPEAFFRLQAQTREEAIEEIGKRMLAMGLIQKSTLDSVKMREKKSSTDIGNLVAVPHTIFQGNLPSVVGIGILPQPIKWGEENVQLLFFISFNSADSANASMFRELYGCVKDIKLVNQLIASSSYDQFIKNFSY